METDYFEIAKQAINDAAEISSNHCYYLDGRPVSTKQLVHKALSRASDLRVPEGALSDLVRASKLILESQGFIVSVGSDL